MAKDFAFLTKPCIGCEETSIVMVDESALRSWQAGTLAQVAFPEMSADKRELLISGTHPACWDAMFSE